MKYLNGETYVEVKDHRYKIHPNEKIKLRKRKPLTSLRTQNQLQNQTQIRKNQKIITNNNNDIEVKNCPENKQSNNQQPNPRPQDGPTGKQNKWLHFDKGYYCRKIFNKQKHQIDKRHS